MRWVERIVKGWIVTLPLKVTTQEWLLMFCVRGRHAGGIFLWGLRAGEKQERNSSIICNQFCFENSLPCLQIGGNRPVWDIWCARIYFETMSSCLSLYLYAGWGQQWEINCFFVLFFFKTLNYLRKYLPRDTQRPDCLVVGETGDTLE